jgi:hypothetical protein
MKTVSIVICSLAVLAANAQTPPTEGALESELAGRLGKAGPLSAQEVKPNEVVKRGVTYSGIAVQLLKTDNPLQLINPLAPPRYGSPEDNVLRDSITGGVSGWKIFSIRF